MACDVLRDDRKYRRRLGIYHFSEQANDEVEFQSQLIFNHKRIEISYVFYTKMQLSFVLETITTILNGNSFYAYFSSVIHTISALSFPFVTFAIRATVKITLNP